jgi:hypothetical protein
MSVTISASSTMAIPEAPPPLPRTVNASALTSMSRVHLVAKK